MSKGGGIEREEIFSRLFVAEGRGAISRIAVREPGYSGADAVLNFCAPTSAWHALSYPTKSWYY